MDTNESSTGNPQVSVKKPYVKPSYKHEQVFVTTALACGKISSTQSSCTSHQSAS